MEFVNHFQNFNWTIHCQILTATATLRCFSATSSAALASSRRTRAIFSFVRTCQLQPKIQWKWVPISDSNSQRIAYLLWCRIFMVTAQLQPNDFENSPKRFRALRGCTRRSVNKGHASSVKSMFRPVDRCVLLLTADRCRICSHFTILHYWSALAGNRRRIFYLFMSCWFTVSLTCLFCAKCGYWRTRKPVSSIPVDPFLSIGSLNHWYLLASDWFVCHRWKTVLAGRKRNVFRGQSAGRHLSGGRQFN